jgi:hypothetical protein
MMEIDDFEHRWVQVIHSLAPDVARTLLNVLTLPDEDRARRIGTLFQAGGAPALAELLMDVEEDPGIRRLLAVELKVALRKGGRAG